MLFREDAFGNSISKVEKFLDSHVGIDSKLERTRNRRISRRVNPLFDEDLRTDLFLGLLHNRVQNRENFRKSLRIARGN